MTKKKWKPSALLAPLPPALVTCKNGEGANILTVGWTGILNSNPPKTYISVRPERYSHDLIKNSGCFVINLPTRSLVKATDYCGVRSGKDTDKLRDMKLSVSPAEETGCPMLNESPVSIECKIYDTVSLGSHDMFLADIVAVYIDGEIVDENDKIRFDKAKLIAYAHGDYFALGEKLGRFGFSVMKKKTAARKKTAKK